MPMATLVTIAIVFGLTSFAVGCGGSSNPDSSAPASQGAEQQSEQPQQESTTQTSQSRADVEFDISDRKQAAARLTILHQILSDGTPISDPIGWAKAGVAAMRVDQICNNFEIDEDLDPACDQLLLATETPFNRVSPVLTAAATELRKIISRRELAEVEHASSWDADIRSFAFDPAMQSALSQLKKTMGLCTRNRLSCADDALASAVAQFLSARPCRVSNRHHRRCRETHRICRDGRFV